MINKVLNILNRNNRSPEEIRILIDFYKGNQFFESIAPQNYDETLYNLFENVYVEKFQKGDIIFKEGDPSNEKMYVIVQGAVVVVINRLGLKLVDKQREVKKYFIENQVEQLQNNQILQLLANIHEYGKIQAVLHSGAYFGEKAIQDPRGKRVSTVFVLDLTHLLIIERKVYIQFKEASQQHWLKMQSTIQHFVPFFDQIDQKRLQDQLIYSFLSAEYKKGDYIIKQGQEKDLIFILTEGDFEISKNIQFNIKPRNSKKNLIYKPSQLQNHTLYSTNKPVHSQVQKDFKIRISQGYAMDIFGCEKLFEQSQLQNIINKFKKSFNEEREFNQIGFHSLLKQKQSSNDQPYLYSVRVISLTAKCIYISKEDFILKFPEQCVQGVQINFLQKLYQRYLKIENTYENVQPTLEEKDKFSWLQPEIAKLSKTNEKAYIQRLYQSYLLGDVSKYCNLQSEKEKNQSSVSTEKFPPLTIDSTEISRLKNNSVHSSQTQNKLESIKHNSMIIQDDQQPQYEIYQMKREQRQKQYRLPETVEFQNMNIKNLELAIKSELVNRGLIKLPKARIFNNFSDGLKKNKSDRIREKIIQSGKNSSIGDSNSNTFSHNQFLDHSQTKIKAKGSQHEYFGSKLEEMETVGSSENNGRATLGFFKLTQFQPKFKQEKMQN